MGGALRLSLHLPFKKEKVEFVFMFEYYLPITYSYQFRPFTYYLDHLGVIHYFQPLRKSTKSTGGD